MTEDNNSNDDNKAANTSSSSDETTTPSKYTNGSGLQQRHAVAAAAHQQLAQMMMMEQNDEDLSTTKGKKKQQQAPPVSGGGGGGGAAAATEYNNNYHDPLYCFTQRQQALGLYTIIVIGLSMFGLFPFVAFSYLEVYQPAPMEQNTLPDLPLATRKVLEKKAISSSKGTSEETNGEAPLPKPQSPPEEEEKTQEQKKREWRQQMRRQRRIRRKQQEEERKKKEQEEAEAAKKKDAEKQQKVQQQATTASTYSDASPPLFSSSYSFDRSAAEAAMEKYGAPALRRTLTAYVEPLWNDTVPGTGSRGDLKNKNDYGTPPTWVTPLPLRTHGPQDLKSLEYPKVQTCHHMPGRFPIDRGVTFDKKGTPVVWNVGDNPISPADLAEVEAPFCPVETDPYLPWIHDVFPSLNGSLIEIIAQNKRRCRTGTKFTDNVNHLRPQVALMQPISVERITEDKAQQLAPLVWHDNNTTAPRYRLAPREESAEDGQSTRFICRFWALDVVGDKQPQHVIVGETLSVYPFDYEFVAYRKSQKVAWTGKGKDSQLFWTSTIRFQCPVPATLQALVASGGSILSDGTPSLYLDIVPIRTSPRYNNYYLTEEQIGRKRLWKHTPFDPGTAWGTANVIPRVEASGRWTNIPICQPPVPNDPDIQKTMAEWRAKADPTTTMTFSSSNVTTTKPQFLSACVWASASYLTRGLDKGATSGTILRMEEWMTYHLLAGFDHFYLYDNSAANTNETDLSSLVDMFPGKVTRVEWNAVVCNNNIPAHDSTGERSSQYAAENSCRTRFAPYTEWIAAFDIDEYLIPMGNYTSLRQVLVDAHKDGMGAQVLSFRSSRGRLRQDRAARVPNAPSAILKLDNATFLESYNCDSAPLPKPEWADRARKQVYRADYVPYHYVHYATVNLDILETAAQSKAAGKRFWYRKFNENRRVQRHTNEVEEAVMIHTKDLKLDQTRGFEEKCHKDFDRKWLGCWVGYPWPKNVEETGDAAHNSDGFDYNCFINHYVDDYWVPKLHQKLAERRRKQQSSAAEQW